MKTWTPEKNKTEEDCELLDVLALEAGASFCDGFLGGLYFKDSFVAFESVLVLNKDANLL